MPETITAYSCAVWLCVGLITGFGWAFAHWVVAKITA